MGLVSKSGMPTSHALSFSTFTKHGTLWGLPSLRQDPEAVAVARQLEARDRAGWPAKDGGLVMDW